MIWCIDCPTLRIFAEKCIEIFVLVQHDNEVIMMFGWFGGLGKKRTAFGKWLDRRGIKQEWVVKETGLNKATVSELASNPDRSPTRKTMQKILKAVRKIDPNVRAEDFWDM
jgi:hypothetical protein